MNFVLLLHTDTDMPKTQLAILPNPNTSCFTTFTSSCLQMWSNRIWFYFWPQRQGAPLLVLNQHDFVFCYNCQMPHKALLYTGVKNLRNEVEWDCNKIVQPQAPNTAAQQPLYERIILPGKGRQSKEHPACNYRKKAAYWHQKERGTRHMSLSEPEWSIKAIHKQKGARPQVNKMTEPSPQRANKIAQRKVCWTVEDATSWANAHSMSSIEWLRRLEKACRHLRPEPASTFKFWTPTPSSSNSMRQIIIEIAHYMPPSIRLPNLALCKICVHRLRQSRAHHLPTRICQKIG